MSHTWQRVSKALCTQNQVNGWVGGEEGLMGVEEEEEEEEERGVNGRKALFFLASPWICPFSSSSSSSSLPVLI